MNLPLNRLYIQIFHKYVLIGLARQGLAHEELFPGNESPYQETPELQGYGAHIPTRPSPPQLHRVLGILGFACCENTKWIYCVGGTLKTRQTLRT